MIAHPAPIGGVTGSTTVASGVGCNWRRVGQLGCSRQTRLRVVVACSVFFASRTFDTLVVGYFLHSSSAHTIEHELMAVINVLLRDFLATATLFISSPYLEAYQDY